MTTFTSELIRHYVEAPERVCLTLLYNDQPDQTISYRRLLQGAAGYAQALHNAGIRPGEVVILILNHGPALVEAFFGAVLHGAVPSIMPFLTEKLDPGHYRRGLASLIEVTRPAAAVTYLDFFEEVNQAGGVNSPLRAILLDTQVTSLTEPDLNEFSGMQRRPEDIVLLQHSSGTTGLQKGVALSHQAVFNQLTSYSRALQITQADVVVSWLPLYHDMGLIAGFLLPILLRLPLVLMSPFDWVRAPVRLLQAVSRFHGTLVWLPNFAYNFCAQKIRQRDLQGVVLSSLRALTNCSEPMVHKSQQMFLERFAPYGLQTSALTTSYAMAENVFAVTQGGISSPVTIDWVNVHALSTQKVATPAPPDDSALPMVSAGAPIDGTRLRVLDNTGNELPERHIGELALQSDCMLTGYYHRPDLTEKAFKNGWYLTGDLGYIANGQVYITGRKKDLIIIGGKNIYPQDLENIANEVPGVHPGRVVAFGVFNEQAGTEDVVLVAESDNEDQTAQQRIADEIRLRITRGSDIAMRYVHVVGRDWLLKTSSGKIARGANREKYIQEVISRSENIITPGIN